ncbi:MAG TPA: rod-binding protein [Gemmatimonadaceae bacterium]|nr:rod-binding protein [Gemmatimonadaceae bacterium]
MSGPLRIPDGATAAGGGRRSAAQEEEALRRTASQLEGVFVQQLFKAMRATVDDEGSLVATGGGETMFRDLLDQRIAEEVPAQWGAEHGLAEKLYQQLRTRLAQSAAAAEPPTTTADADQAAAKETH